MKWGFHKHSPKRDTMAAAREGRHATKASGAVVCVADSITIDRAAEDVFEYATCPETACSWRSGLSEARQVAEGAMGVGTKVWYRRALKGRKSVSTEVVTEFERNRTYRSRDPQAQPFGIEGGWRLEPQNGGTKLTFEYCIELGRFLRLARPLARALFTREVTRDFRNLKAILEVGAGSEVPQVA